MNVPLPPLLRAGFALLAVALLCAACVPSGATHARECIAPANAGGGWDLTCRSLARVLDELGMAPPLQTSNMPGAGGGVAFAHTVVQRTGDAHVLVAASPATTLRLAQGQYGDLTERDVRWLGALAAEYGILAVAAESPLRSLEDLLAAWRTDPGSVVVGGGSAVAGQDHMKVLLLARRAGIPPTALRYVSFDGGGEAMTALLGGFIQLFSGEASEVAGQVRAGRLRVLAVLAPSRLGGDLADVPTAREQGVALDWITWRGFYAPAGLDDTEYAAWTTLLARVGASDEWARVRDESRLEPFLMVGDTFSAFVEAQVEDFRAISRDLGLLK